MKLIFVLKFFLISIFQLKAQTIIWNYNGNVIEFQTDTLSFSIEKLALETKRILWHVGDSYSFYVLDDFDQKIQKIQINGKQVGLLMMVGNKDYLFETITQSEQNLLVSEFQYGSREIRVWVYEKKIQNIICGILKYKKLEKNQPNGYRNRLNFAMYWNENTQELIVPLEHNDISDSFQTRLPLFGVFKYKKGKFEMTKSFGFIPKEQMNFKDAQLFKMQMDYLSKKIVLFYIDGAIQVFDAETYQELMYFPGLKKKINFNGVHQFYIPEKDLYFFRYRINDLSPDGQNLIPKAYARVVKNTKNPVKVYDGEELFYRDNEMPIRFSHRATNEYYEVLDYEGGDTLKVVLYHLK